MSSGFQNIEISRSKIKAKIGHFLDFWGRGNQKAPKVEILYPNDCQILRKYVYVSPFSKTI